MISNLESNNQSGVPLYQLKITLKWSKPPIWRCLAVRANMSLDRLHSVIQTVMGWTDSHLYQFIAGAGFALTYYGNTSPEFGGMGGAALNARRYTVADLAPTAKRTFIYEYDFGDGWQHDVVAEKLGRKWIATDLGKFGIHTTRKRLIQVQRALKANGKTFRAFEVLNLGRYERHAYLNVSANLSAKKKADALARKEQEFRDLILKAYQAEPLGREF